MRPHQLVGIALASCVGAGALATPVDDFRNGENASFDLRAATITSAGAASINFVIEDSDAPPFCAPKARGTLDFDVDLFDFGFPVSIPVTLTGQALSDTTVRWTAGVDVNQCFNLTLPDGTPVSLLVREVAVVLTGDLSPSPATLEPYCIARRGVVITTTEGVGENAIDVTGYALCLQTSFTRVDIDVRAIDTIGRGGDDPCPGDTNADNSIDFGDLNAVLSAFGLQSSPGELGADLNLDGAVDFGDLNAVLSAFGQSCGM